MFNTTTTTSKEIAMKSSTPVDITNLLEQVKEYSLETVDEDIVHTLGYMDCLLGEHEQHSPDYIDIRDDIDDVEDAVDDFKRDLEKFVSSLKTLREYVVEK